MPDFMESFEKSRNDYLEHYGVQGMKWGVVNEEEPVGMQQVGQQETYTPTEGESQAANTVREKSPEEVKERRKEIAKKVAKGVAIAAIIAGLTVAGVKGYAKKKTGGKQSLGSSIGIVGQGVKNAATGFVSNIQSGFSMDTKKVKKMAEANTKRKKTNAKKAAETAKAQDRAFRNARREAFKENVKSTASNLVNRFRRRGPL